MSIRIGGSVHKTNMLGVLMFALINRFKKWQMVSSGLLAKVHLLGDH